jgi:cyclophilin family peptidyl-prolyl cis-trans isomerase
MARTQPDTAQGQWFFAMKSLPQLEGDYTRFGVITRGLEVANHLTTEDQILDIQIIGGNEP